MGTCCTSKPLTNIEKIIGKRMAEAIEKNSVSKIQEIIQYYCMTQDHSKKSIRLYDINQPIVKIYGQDMNALGYALFLGNTEIFSLILEQAKAKLSKMSRFYANFSKRPIDIICELGHKQLLEFYIPFYLGKSDEIEESDSDSISLSISRFKNTKSHINEKSRSVVVLGSMSPLHKACEKGRLNIVQFIYEYFKNKKPPNEFDVHYIDEYTGDNCSLISCRTGNIDLLRYLHEVCNANFKIINKRKESAIQILAIWSKKKKPKKFKDCFRYIIEIVGIDYVYEIEETLLVLEDLSIVKYLENKLRDDGISISKNKIDDKYSISKNRVPPTIDPVLENKLNGVRGSRFSFLELFKEELEESKIDISSINGDCAQSIDNLTFIDMRNRDNTIE